jgi:hypothetical protein
MKCQWNCESWTKQLQCETDCNSYYPPIHLLLLKDVFALKLIKARPVNFGFQQTNRSNFNFQSYTEMAFKIQESTCSVIQVLKHTSLSWATTSDISVELNWPLKESGCFVTQVFILCKLCIDFFTLDLCNPGATILPSPPLSYNHVPLTPSGWAQRKIKRGQQ